MSDRELLLKAAKAAGYWSAEFNCPSGLPAAWDPLADDGDALRLAVKLGLVVDCSRPSAGPPFYSHEFRETDASDVAAATRRAIVRAAAAIGEKA